MEIAAQILEKLILGHVNKLEQIGAESVAILLKKISCIIEHNSGKMIETKRGVDVRLGFQIVSVVAMFLMQFVQHSLV